MLRTPKVRLTARAAIGVENLDKQGHDWFGRRSSLTNARNQDEGEGKSRQLFARKCPNSCLPKMGGLMTHSVGLRRDTHAIATRIA